MKPDLWQPIAKHIQELQQWIKRLDNLIANKTQESNRIKGTVPKVVSHIQRHIDFLNIEIKEVEQLIADHIKQHKDLEDKHELLSSIPGVGDKTIAIVLAFLDAGDLDLRKAFYMPAVVSIRFNPIIKAFYQRLINEGKPKMVAVIAAMCKLLHIIYGILKTRTLFNTNIQMI